MATSISDKVGQVLLKRKFNTYTWGQLVCCLNYINFTTFSSIQSTCQCLRNQQGFAVLITVSLRLGPSRCRTDL